MTVDTIILMDHLSKFEKIKHGGMDGWILMESNEFIECILHIIIDNKKGRHYCGFCSAFYSHLKTITSYQNRTDNQGII